VQPVSRRDQLAHRRTAVGVGVVPDHHGRAVQLLVRGIQQICSAAEQLDVNQFASTLSAHRHVRAFCGSLDQWQKSVFSRCKPPQVADS
jgi:hypothetical protein